MRLTKARVRKYRSIQDTGLFDVEDKKTILVGPNEAGKTVILRALQQLHAPDGVDGFDPLRDYPRAEYNDISTGAVDPAKVTVVEGHFALEPDDLEGLSKAFHECVYVYGRKLDNKGWHRIDGGPDVPTCADVKKDLTRLCAHVKPKASEDAEDPSQTLASTTDGWVDKTTLADGRATKLTAWLESVFPLVDENSSAEEKRYDRLVEAVGVDATRDVAIKHLKSRLPVFVLFNNYFRVRPRIHLDHLGTDADLHHHAWSPEELAARRLAGERCFTVPVSHGASVQMVSIQNMRTENLRMVRKKAPAPGVCKGDIGGCPAGIPCTEVIDGEEYCTTCCIS